MIYSEVVKTYEQNFQMLEIARGEYLRMVEKIFSRLGDEFQNTQADILSIIHKRSKAEAKSVFSSSFKLNGSECCTVLARVATPWGDDRTQNGKVHIALEFVPQPDYLPEEKTKLFELGRNISGWPTGLPQGLTDLEGTEKWLVVKVVDVTVNNPLEDVVAAYTQALELAEKYARVCDDRTELVKKVYTSMKMVVTSLNETPLCDDQTTEPESVDDDFPDWEGMNYIQVNYHDDENRSIWFCVNPTTRNLLYFHNDEREDLHNQMIQLVNGELRELDGTFGCQLMTEDELDALTVEDIRDRIVSTARVFYETVVDVEEE